MHRLTSIVAFLLLGLWLPATTHCGLEAAGLEWFGGHDEHDEDARSICTDGACHAVEDDFYAKTECDAKPLVGPLELFADWWSVAFPCGHAVEGPRPACCVDPPAVESLKRTWQFACRAAVPARAPDHIA